MSCVKNMATPAAAEPSSSETMVKNVDLVSRRDSINNSGLSDGRMHHHDEESHQIEANTSQSNSSDVSQQVMKAGEQQDKSPAPQTIQPVVDGMQKKTKKKKKKRAIPAYKKFRNDLIHDAQLGHGPYKLLWGGEREDTTPVVEDKQTDKSIQALGQREFAMKLQGMGTKEWNDLLFFRTAYSKKYYHQLIQMHLGFDLKEAHTRRRLQRIRGGDKVIRGPETEGGVGFDDDTISMRWCDDGDPSSMTPRVDGVVESSVESIIDHPSILDDNNRRYRYIELHRKHIPRVLKRREGLSLVRGSKQKGDVESHIQTPEESPTKMDCSDEKISSVDIVAAVFAISDELKNEREEMNKINQERVLGVHSGDGALMNGEVTLKYSKMLDETDERKLMNQKLEEKAEVIRHRNLLLDGEDMSLLWERILKKKSGQKKARVFKNVAAAMMRANKLAKLHEMGWVNLKNEEARELIAPGRVVSEDLSVDESIQKGESITKHQLEDTQTPSAGDVKKGKYLGTRSLYSNTRSKSYDMPREMQGVGLKLVKESKRKQLKQLMSRIIHLENTALNAGDDLHRLSDRDKNSLYQMETAMENCANAIYAYRLNGRIFYEEHMTKTDVTKHPYYEIYADSGWYGLDPKLERCGAPRPGDGTTYVLGSGLSMHRARRRQKELDKEQKRRRKQARKNINKKKKKTKGKSSLNIAYPIKVVGGDCDEVIFDMDAFVLIIRSVRNGVQYDVTVALDTLYVTKSHNESSGIPMVTLRSAEFEDGYITTIKAKDWFEVSEQIERALYYKHVAIKSRPHDDEDEEHDEGNGVIDGQGISPSMPPVFLTEAENDDDDYHDHDRDGEDLRSAAPHGFHPSPPLSSPLPSSSTASPHIANIRKRMLNFMNGPKEENNSSLSSSGLLNPWSSTCLSPNSEKPLKGAFPVNQGDCHTDAQPFSMPIASSMSHTPVLDFPCLYVMSPQGRNIDVDEQEKLSTLSSLHIGEQESSQDNTQRTTRSLPHNLSSTTNYIGISQPKTWHVDPLYQPFALKAPFSQRPPELKPYKDDSVTNNMSLLSHHHLLQQSEITDGKTDIKRLQLKSILAREKHPKLSHVLFDEETPDKYSNDLFGLDMSLHGEEAVTALVNDLRGASLDPRAKPTSSIAVTGAKPPLVSLLKTATSIRSAVHTSPIAPRQPPRGTQDEGHNRDDNNDGSSSSSSSSSGSDVSSDVEDNAYGTASERVPSSPPIKSIRKPSVPVTSNTRKRMVTNDKKVLQRGKDNCTEESNPKNPLCGEGKSILLIEPGRLMGMYFRKKFAAMTIPVDVHTSLCSAVLAILTAPSSYSLVFCSFDCLGKKDMSDFENSICQLMNPPAALWSESDQLKLSETNVSKWNPAYFSESCSVVIYGDITFNDDNPKNAEISFTDEEDYEVLELLEQQKRNNQMNSSNISETLEAWGVADLLEGPYTLNSIRNVVLANKDERRRRKTTEGKE